jgi:cell filamentation protein
MTSGTSCCSTAAFAHDRAAVDGAISTIGAHAHGRRFAVEHNREGNARPSRLPADVMAVQAGHEPLDYSAWKRRKSDDIAAIHAGLSCNYGPM